MVAENVPNGVLSTPQRKAIDALTSGATKIQAAAAARRTERTVNRWLGEPLFAGTIQAITDLSISDASRRLAAMLEDAIGVLSDIMRDDDVPVAIRMKAASSIIEHMIRLREHGDLAERVARLEEQLT